MLWNNAGKDNDKGQLGELFALNYLLAQGLQFSSQNVHSRHGEIDLVMREGHTLVFVEVKYRKNNGFGGAISAVTYNKQQKIRKCATFYLQQHGLNEYNSDCRFDVVALQGDIAHPKVTWVKNAF